MSDDHVLHVREADADTAIYDCATFDLDSISFGDKDSVLGICCMAGLLKLILVGVMVLVPTFNWTPVTGIEVSSLEVRARDSKLRRSHSLLRMPTETAPRRRTFLNSDLQGQ